MTSFFGIDDLTEKTGIEIEYISESDGTYTYHVSIPDTHTKFNRKFVCTSENWLEIHFKAKSYAYSFGEVIMRRKRYEKENSKLID